eukprot:scaffold1382_cov195-Chaetoceros_neogracile.AAC.1
MESMKACAVAMEVSLGDIRKERDCLRSQLEKLSKEISPFDETYENDLIEITALFRSNESASIEMLSKLEEDLRKSKAAMTITVSKVQEELVKSRESIKRLKAEHEAEMNIVIEGKGEKVAKFALNTVIANKNKQISQLSLLYDKRIDNLEQDQKKFRAERRDIRSKVAGATRQRMAAEQEVARLSYVMSTALDEARNNISQLQNDLEKEQSQVISLRTNIEGLAASSQKGEVANKKRIDDMISKQKLDFETTLKSHEDRFKSEMAVVNKKKLALESEMAEKMQELVMAMDSIEELSTSVEEGKSYDEVAEKYTLLILTVEEKDAAIKSLEDSIAKINDEHVN